MACQCRAGNTEQFCRPPLVLICLLINESDVPFHRAFHRQIDTRLFCWLLLARVGNDLANSEVTRSGSRSGAAGRESAGDDYVRNMFSAGRPAGERASFGILFRFQIVDLGFALHFRSFCCLRLFVHICLPF